MRRFAALASALIFALVNAPAQAQTVNPNLLAGMQWRNIGPLRGGRALAVTGVPSQPDTFYFGAVGGGVWVTHNAGRTWTPIFDSEPVASIGAIAVAPSDPNTIYVGSGEADMRSDIQQGDGMYKSTDAGKTWTHIGLDDTAQIGSIVVDPHDANIVYVAALGHPYDANAQRGVFKSIDGGKTWQKVLYKNADTGAIDLAMDPSDSNVIFAALWQVRRPAWNVYPPTSGPGSGLYKSTDAGKTWTHVQGHGFPAGVGRIGVAVSAADHNRVYAFADTNNIKNGGIYRSDDGGATWSYTDGEKRIWQRGWYFGGITADPKDPNEVYVMNTSTYRSTDGGKSFTAIKGAPGGDDYHTLWIDPNDTSHMILGSDQGVVISLDNAQTWSSWYNQSTAQLYHVITDHRFPYWVYGAQQDSGAVAVPSRSIHRNISMFDWLPIDAGGESGTIAPDPLHPGRVYANPGDGGLNTYEDVSSNWELVIDPTLKYPNTVWRSTWTLPIVSSPQNPQELYSSHQRIFRSLDGGRSWSFDSPDLTRTRTRGVVYCIAPSPVRAHEIWAGTDDGYIWITRDDGAHWTNVTPPQLSVWSKVGIIDASHFDAQTAYAAIDRHRLGDNRPYIYKTHDGGKHWTPIASGLPQNLWVNVVREDPHERGLLYAGNERSVYVSFDDGAQWQPLKLNLPPASIRDIVFNGDDVIVGTHGRGIWILDDASPLRQIAAARSALARNGAYLFKPAVAYRTRPGSDQGTPLPPDVAQEPNPPTGAIIDYAIGSATTPVTISISDASGRTVRSWSSTDKPKLVDPKKLDIPAFWVKPQYPPSAQPGAHRWIWDFAYGDKDKTLAPPGNYTVRLRVNGKTFTQQLNLRRDPTYPASNADLQAQFTLAREIEADQSAAAAALKRAKALIRNPKHDKRLDAVVGREPSGSPDDSVGQPARDFGSLRYIGDALQTLESSIESVDARPTPDQYAAYAVLHGEVRKAIATVNAVR